MSTMKCPSDNEEEYDFEGETSSTAERDYSRLTLMIKNAKAPNANIPMSCIRPL